MGFFDLLGNIICGKDVDYYLPACAYDGRFESNPDLYIDGKEACYEFLSGRRNKSLLAYNCTSDEEPLLKADHKTCPMKCKRCRYARYEIAMRDGKAVSSILIKPCDRRGRNLLNRKVKDSIREAKIRAGVPIDKL